MAELVQPSNKEKSYEEIFRETQPRQYVGARAQSQDQQRSEKAKKDKQDCLEQEVAFFADQILSDYKDNIERKSNQMQSRGQNMREWTKNMIEEDSDGGSEDQTCEREDLNEVGSIEQDRN